MGAAAQENADLCIVTSDNPRSEEPEEIIGEILKGMIEKNILTIPNRREAIAAALSSAKPGDVVMLIGKGHETYQEICGVKHPFDERIIVKELVEP
jgi:UDP-N-acetylmuramoyl-L-alanyl-D-glutamate--2,6-diaminopimelate ligase